MLLSSHVFSLLYCYEIHFKEGLRNRNNRKRVETCDRDAKKSEYRVEESGGIRDFVKNETISK